MISQSDCARVAVCGVAAAATLLLVRSLEAQVELLHLHSVLHFTESYRLPRTVNFSKFFGFKTHGPSWLAAV